MPGPVSGSLSGSKMHACVVGRRPVDWPILQLIGSMAYLSGVVGYTVPVESGPMAPGGRGPGCPAVARIVGLAELLSAPGTPLRYKRLLVTPAQREPHSME